jgi:membrane protein YdbS with pleckstrin-like domain
MTEAGNDAHGRVLAEATFESALWQYYYWYGVIILAVSVYGIALIPLWMCFGIYTCKVFAGTFELTLHEKVLLLKKGGVCFHCCARVEKTILLDRIQDLSIQQGCLEKCLGVITLKVETAGSSQPGAELFLPGIRDSSEFRDMVLRQRHNYVHGARPLDEKSPETAARPTRRTSLDESVAPLANLLSQIRDLLEKQSSV